VWRWESDAFGLTTPEITADSTGHYDLLDLRFPGQLGPQNGNGVYYNINRDYEP